MKATTFIILVAAGLTIRNGYGQKNYAKASLLAIPTPMGAGIFIHAGFERMNKPLQSSWQLGVYFAAGQFGMDAPGTTRKWLTLDRNYYFKKDELRKKIFVSIFTEVADRKINPGFIRSSDDTIIYKKITTDICPGIANGQSFISIVIYSHVSKKNG
jgi:hypothetical protein